MTIFMMWYQGLAEAPPLVQRIHRLWQVANPDREVRLIDGPEAEAIISGLGVDAARLSMQQRANMVRVALLADHGGAWVDATLLPARPLDDWLPALVAPSGFFAHRTRGSDRLLDNWFLAGEAGNPLLTAWRDAHAAYFRTPRTLDKSASFLPRIRRELRRALAPTSFAAPAVAGRSATYPYHIHTYILHRLTKTDPEVRRVWGATPRLEGSLAMRLKKACNRTPGGLTDAGTLAGIFATHPVHKLNWRKPEVFDAALDVAEAHWAGR